MPFTKKKKKNGIRQEHITSCFQTLAGDISSPTPYPCKNLTLYRGWRLKQRSRRVLIFKIHAHIHIFDCVQCVCVCIVIPFILDVRLRVDAPAGVTQEEGHTGFLYLPSAVLALIFVARMIQPSLSLVDREVNFCVPTNYYWFSTWARFFIFIFREEK